MDQEVLAALKRWEEDGEDFGVSLGVEIQEPFKKQKIDLGIEAVWVSGLERISLAIEKFVQLSDLELLAAAKHMKSHCVDMLSIDRPEMRVAIQDEWNEGRIFESFKPIAVTLFVSEEGEVFICWSGDARWNVDHGVSVTWCLFEEGLRLERVGDDDGMYVNCDRNYIYKSSVDDTMSTLKSI